MAVHQFAPIRELTESAPLVKLVGKWRAFVGLPKEDVTEEIAIVSQYIRESFGFLTIAEIDLAINLSVNRRLDDCDFYGYFSPMYISKVLQAYMHYRKITMADAIRRKEKFELEEAEKRNKPTPEEEAILTQELILGFYKEFLKKGKINDPFNLAYNFLRKHKWMKVSESDISEAMEVGKTMYQESDKKANLYEVVSSNSEVEIKRYARNYLVTKYFKNVEIDVVINNIKPELFRNLE